MRRVEPLVSSLALAVFFGLAFFAMQKLTFLLRFLPYDRTTLWVPGALTFTALLILPPRRWWAIYLGLCAGGFSAYYGEPHISGGMALLAAQFHFATVAAAAWLIRRFSHRPPFSSVGSLTVFVIAAGFFVPLATTGPIELYRWSVGASDVGPTAIRTFLCTSLGMMIATPPLTVSILEFPAWRQRLTRSALLEILVLAVSLAAVGAWVFTTTTASNVMPALIYAPIPLLVWAALRFEIAGTGWALLTIAYLSTWSAIHDLGPFVSGNRADHVLQLQLFLLALSLPLMFTAASVKDRRQAYSALVAEIEERRRMEDRFRLVVEATPNAMLMIDRKGHVVLMNQQLHRWFGYDGAELLGKHLSKLVPENQRARLEGRIQKCFAQEQSVGEAIENVGTALRKNGTQFPVEIELTPIQAGSEPMALATLIDQSERHRAEEAQRDLVHASRLAVLSEFTASLAHEINQPLAAILSNAEAAEMLLDTNLPPLDEVRRILADIRQDDLRASDVIKKLRMLFRRGTVERQSVDIQRVIQDVLGLMRNESQRRGIEIVTELRPERLAVSGEPVHLQQVLLNLVINAMESMEQQERPKRITISASEQADMILISISDSGPGIPAEIIPKLFDRFFSTKREGMGMGLAISRSLIEEHGGRLWAENNTEWGATFHFRLPRQSAVDSFRAEDRPRSLESLS